MLKKQQGISLFGVLGSLGVITIVLALFAKYFFIVNHNDKINKVHQQIYTLISAIASWKTQNAMYSALPSLSIDTLSKQGFLENATLNNPWGYRIMMTNVEGEGAKIQTTLPSIPACRALRQHYPHAKKCRSGQFTLYVTSKMGRKY